MANLTFSGAFYNNQVGTVALVLYQDGVLLPVNPPDLSENPYTRSAQFDEDVSLNTGVYELHALGGTDGIFTLAITGDDFTLDHQPPGQYNQSINDSFQITVA